jgi:hypothetical protein
VPVEEEGTTEALKELIFVEFNSKVLEKVFGKGVWKRCLGKVFGKGVWER